MVTAESLTSWDCVLNFNFVQEIGYTLKLVKGQGESTNMFTISEVAQRAGIRSSAVRYYERQGILPPAVRRQNGYRSYNDNSIKLVLFTTRARSLGITLKEIKFLLNLIFAGQKP